MRKSNKRPSLTLVKNPRPRPSDIRGQLRVLNNINFVPSPKFKIYPRQRVFRKSNPRVILQVLGYHDGKLFLSDLSYAKEAELCCEGISET